jgi:hypothetical protein
MKRLALRHFESGRRIFGHGDFRSGRCPVFLLLGKGIMSRLYRVISLNGLQVRETADGQTLPVVLTMIHHSVNMLSEYLPCLQKHGLISLMQLPIDDKCSLDGCRGNHFFNRINHGRDLANRRPPGVATPELTTQDASIIFGRGIGSLFSGTCDFPARSSSRACEFSAHETLLTDQNSDKATPCSSHMAETEPAMSPGGINHLIHTLMIFIPFSASASVR